MTSVLPQLRFRSEAPFVARSALRSIGASLNFSIIALVSTHLRQNRLGAEVPEADAHFGQTVDSRNEIDAAVEGAEIEAQLHQDQGFAVALKPLDLASRLKVIRDSCAAELERNAGMRRDPVTNKMYRNQYDVVAPLAESINWLVSQDARIDNAVVQKTAAVIGMDEGSIRLLLEKRHYTQQKFLKDNANDIISIVESLTYKGEDGHEFGIEDDETVEERLPAMNRARIFVAADKGLWNERNRWVGLFINNNPEAIGNIGIIDGERELIHAKYSQFLNNSDIKAEINDAVERGARYPKLLALFPRVKQAA